MSRLPKNLQIVNLKRMFQELNPFCDPDVIDWSHVVDETLSYQEQVESMREEYPEYRWAIQDDYSTYYKNYLKEEASNIGFNLTRYEDVKKIGRSEKENNMLKNRQEKIATNAPITEEEALSRIYGVPPKILDDLEKKAIVVGGEAGHGKTQMVKTIVEAAMRKGTVVKVFDISLAWWHDSPMLHRMVAQDWGSPPNTANIVYDMATITSQNRRNLVSRIIYDDWNKRYNSILEDEDYVKKVPRILYVFEEANCFFDSSSLNRKDWSAQIFYDFISTRRNYGLDCIIVTTRISGEISPKIRNRCNYLLARLIGSEERNYLSKAASKEVVDEAIGLPPYKFVYYGSEQILKPFGVEYRTFGHPRDIQQWTPKLEYPPRENKRRGILSRLLNL